MESRRVFFLAQMAFHSMASCMGYLGWVSESPWSCERNPLHIKEMTGISQWLGIRASGHQSKCIRCWWKESQTTTQHVRNPVNNGIFAISTGDRRISEPSTVSRFFDKHDGLFESTMFFCICLHSFFAMFLVFFWCRILTARPWKVYRLRRGLGDFAALTCFSSWFIFWNKFRYSLPHIYFSWFCHILSYFNCVCLFRGKFHPHVFMGVIAGHNPYSL